MALVDPRLEHEVHQTFGYWYEGQSLLPEGIGQTWSSWVVSSPSREIHVELGDWRYETFDLQDWMEAKRVEVEEAADVTWLPQQVVSVETIDRLAVAETNSGERLEGRWVFDSRPGEPPEANLALRQHFRGRRVRTANPVTDADQLRLMDFRRREDDVLFSYVVPRPPNELFVESVIISEHQHEEAQSFELDAICASLSESEPDILAREGGVTTLTPAPFPRRSSRRVVNIGLRGGAARPSTGYAFVPIHREAEAIADALAERDNPWGRPPRRRRDCFLDAVLLTLLAEYPERGPEVFVTLFEKARTDRVLRLLDSRASWLDIVAIITVLPWLIFLRAFWRWFWRYRK
jgi:lycopene beta-cyclase